MFSLENLALVESFAYMFEFTLPCKVFLHHGLAFFAVHIQLAPSVGLIVNLPIITQLRGDKKKKKKKH